MLDLACGHGLLAYILLLLDDTSPDALAIDPRIPPSAGPLRESLFRTWPRLRGRVHLLQGSLEDAPVGSADLVVSAHACGPLTDLVIERAIAARARVAVLPCCHRLGPERHPLQGWMDGALAVDVTRATRLQAAGYRVRALQIPEDITPKNRLLLGQPL